MVLLFLRVVRPCRWNELEWVVRLLVGGVVLLRWCVRLLLRSVSDDSLFIRALLDLNHASLRQLLGEVGAILGASCVTDGWTHNAIIVMVDRSNLWQCLELLFLLLFQQSVPNRLELFGFGGAFVAVDGWAAIVLLGLRLRSRSTDGPITLGYSDICDAFAYHLLLWSGSLSTCALGWGLIRSVHEWSVRLTSPCINRARPVHKLHLWLSHGVSFRLYRMHISKLVIASEFACASLAALSWLVSISIEEVNYVLFVRVFEYMELLLCVRQFVDH